MVVEGVTAVFPTGHMLPLGRDAAADEADPPASSGLGAGAAASDRCWGAIQLMSRDLQLVVVEVPHPRRALWVH